MLIVHMYLVKNYFLFFDNQITFDVFPLNSFVCLIFYHCGPTTVCARCLVVWYFTEFLFISFNQVNVDVVESITITLALVSTIDRRTGGDTTWEVCSGAKVVAGGEVDN